jgi:3-dehydroquinate synthase
MTQTVRVNLGNRSYDILVGRGSLARLGSETTSRVAGGTAEGRLAVVLSSPAIARRYGMAARASLEAAGFRIHMALTPAGERSKTLASVSRLYGALYDQAADRRTVVVALGGGVVGDMAGFVAATYARGLDFVQVPTTLLAQVDSSVGGKTGVNFGSAQNSAKNLIGAFHQPRLVVIDPDTLGTLPLRERRSGLAEVIKYGIIGDKDFFALLECEMAGLLDLSSPHLEHVLAHSCALKARVVELDEHEGGLRAILNFGHTVGHALEALTQYRTYTHGEAIAVGMVSAALVGEEVGVTQPDDTAALTALLRAAGFVVRLDPAHSVDEVTRLLAWDKKSVGGSARFVLMEEIGRATPGHQVSEAAIRRALERQRGLDA